MRRIPAIVVMATLAAAVPVSRAAQEPPAPSQPLTVEKIFAHGPLIGPLPTALTWSPNGKHLTYLDGGELIDLDPQTSQPHVLVSRAKLAALAGAEGSEEDRDHRERYKMASYLWAPDSTHLLFDANGRLWLYDLHNGTGVQVGFTETLAGDDPKFSPNGEAVSFIRNHGIAVIRQKDFSNNPQVVGGLPGGGVMNGEVDWVYSEEMEVRSNYFWSPDSHSIAFLQMNEAQVTQYPIPDWIPTHAHQEIQFYPQAGDLNPDVRLGIVSGTGGRTEWMKLPIRAEQDYVPRFGWIDRKTLWVEVVTRDHKHRRIYFADTSSGQTRQALEINDDKFVDDNYDVEVSPGHIVLTNWTDGRNHIYLYDFDAGAPVVATLNKQLTSGDFDVSAVSTVDWANKTVYYASNESNVLEQQLWSVSFAGERKQLTIAPGFHEGNFAPSGGTYVDTYSTTTTPPVLSLCHAGAKCSVFWQSHALDALALKPPVAIEAKAQDGSTLYATLQLPEGSISAASVPLIVNPYGGPSPNTVANRWEASLLFNNVLAQHGFAVLSADNRGTGMRGRAFAQEAYHNFGPVQLEDQLKVVDAALAKYPQLDPNRLGWWGWSWGGSFTLYAMSHSDRFKAGVAVAPVTDWRNYDSIYTERYLGQPAESADEYKKFSPITSAADLKGHILLVHGTGDDNVHLANTIQYIQKLIDAGIPYDLQIFPRKTHAIAGPEARTQLYQRILAHFEQYLKPPAH